MKRVISFLTAAAIAVSLVTAAAEERKENIITMRIGDPRITINGKAQSIDSEGTVPVIRNDRTLLPVRAFVEGIGGKAEWDENARIATLSYGGDEIKLTIDSEKAYLNNELKTLDTKPVIINNRTMLPIRFIAESFGYTVVWDQPTETVTVTGMAMTDTIAATEAGLVRGSLSDGIYEYLGVPYAEAKELFVKADKVTPWEGVRDATEYGDTSIQGALFGAAAAGAAEGTSNSCQNLNIWTPSINDGGKRAVMVWLHGGGFSTGSANEGSVDGENLSRSGDVVVVGVNHRLNLFGHLDLSAYGEKYRNSENIGIQDIIDALAWIRDNIESFGGDPDNVTIFGESGGGAKVLALMTSPYAKGLFRRAIVESGATEGMGVYFSKKEHSAAIGALTLEKLGLTADTVDAIQKVDIAKLQSVTDEAKAEIAEKYQVPVSIGEGYAYEWEPVVDGDFLPTDPVLDKGFAEAGRDVELLIGSNLNEWSIWMPDQSHPDMTDEEKAEYAKAYPNEAAETAIYVDTLIRKPMLKIMSHKADQNGAKVYAYVFTKQIGDQGSYHTAEIPFVFNNTDDALAKTMSEAWANFAKTGVPSAKGLSEWEPYTREGMATMILDDESYLAHDHDKRLIEMLEPDYEY